MILVNQHVKQDKREIRLRIFFLFRSLKCLHVCLKNPMKKQNKNKKKKREREIASCCFSFKCERHVHLVAMMYWMQMMEDDQHSKQDPYNYR